MAHDAGLRQSAGAGRSVDAARRWRCDDRSPAHIQQRNAVLQPAVGLVGLQLHLHPDRTVSLGGIAQFTANQALQNTTSALLNKALGREGSLSDALQSSLVNAFAAYGFNLVGDIGLQNDLPEGGLAKIGLHAVMGGLASLAAGGDFKTGALAAGVNEALVGKLASAYAGMSKEDRDRLLLMNSQLIGVLTTAIQDPDADNAKLQTGSWVAQSGTQYNLLGHQEIDDLESEARGCEAKGNCEEVRNKFRQQSVADDDALAALCASSPDQCVELFGDLLHDRYSLLERLGQMSRDDSIPSMFKEDIHRYQMQNTNAISVLTKAQSELNFLNQGVSAENAGWFSDLFAAMAGGL